MSNDTKKILDLDELFGQARTVKVKFGGREYELLRVEALGPKSLSRFQGLQKRSMKLQMKTLDGDLSDEQDAEIVSLFDEMLGMLCAGLPLEKMGFAMKAKVLEFYVQETQAKNSLDVAQGKGSRKKRTGATSSRS